MGENEQGGMLRTVVVIGLVALIASVVIAGVVVSKANMNKHVTDTTSLVEKQVNATSATSRNLYLNSKGLRNDYGVNWGQTTKVTVEAFDRDTNMWHIVAPQNAGANVGIYLWDYANGKISNNSDWSYSADIKGTGKVVEFGIENSGQNAINGNVGREWSRISQTGHVYTPPYKTIVMYFDTTNSPLDVYIKLPKLETGNTPTDWTPAPED